MRQRIKQAVRVAQSSTPEYRLFAPGQCLVLMTKHEEIVRQEVKRSHLDVNGRRAQRDPVRFGSVDGKHTLLVMPGRGKFSKIIQGGPMAQ